MSYADITQQAIARTKTLREKVKLQIDQVSDTMLQIELSELKVYYPAYFHPDELATEMSLLNYMKASGNYSPHSAFVDLYKPPVGRQIAFLRYRSRNCDLDVEP